MSLCPYLLLGLSAWSAVAGSLGDSAGDGARDSRAAPESGAPAALNGGEGNFDVVKQSPVETVIPVVQLDDDDTYFEEAKRDMEKKHAPNHWWEFFYPIMVPVLGGVMAFLSLPCMWFNERRAASGFTESSNKDKDNAGAGADAEGGGENKQGHSYHALKNPNQIYEEKVDKFEHWLCRYVCCRGVEFACKKLPQGGNHDVLTWGGRVGGFMMLWIGLNMTFYPIYFILHWIWFVGAIIAGSLFFCICKCAVCASCCTVASSYTLHKPAILAMVICIFIGLICFNFYMMGAPEYSHGRYKFHPDRRV